MRWLANSTVALSADRAPLWYEQLHVSGEYPATIGEIQAVTLGAVGLDVTDPPGHVDDVEIVKHDPIPLRVEVRGAA